ncbi:MAG TPA: cyclic nucleotide-binding and patatin-like phospholipase domain-containing protein [Longimicrobium sp.]|nr:cyclic nucleotide-binding and patatin-like phospholipase domain-containing protein [Longimicrobium sp.]
MQDSAALSPDFHAQLATHFAGLEPEAADALAAAMRPVHLAAGGVLLRTGQAPPAFYLVLAGELHVAERQPGQDEALLRVIGPGEALDELQVLAGSRGSVEVRAATDAELARVDDRDRDGLATRFPPLRAQWERIQRHQLLCRLHAVFGTMNGELLSELDGMAEWVHRRRGELLFEQNEAGGALYLVISGRLRTVRIDKGGATRVLGEAARGEMVGEMSFFGCEPRGERVEAVRDSVLVGFTNAEFDTLVARRPQTLRHVTRLVIDRMARGRPETQGRVTNVAVIAASPGAPVAAFCDRLAAALAAHGRTLHLTAQGVEERMAEAGIAQAWGESGDAARLMAWLEAREVDHRFVVYQAEEGASVWTRRCMRQADRVLLVARADEDPGPGPVEQALARLEDRATDAYEVLVIVHPDGRVRPSGTRRWLAGRRVREHVHLRWDGAADFARLGRMLAGRSVGLVLGGGGARGFAHIGVLRAMAEAGVPVDFIGGTSMGAAVAAQYALGVPPDELLAVNRRIYLEWRPHKQLTVPMVSLVDNRLAGVCGERVYGDAEIEDLWTPYFCVTSNLTTAEMGVHRTGLLRKYVLASASIPVFAPPVLEGNHLLVDGALLNNLPADVMREQGVGIVIASEVSLEEDASFTAERVPTGWEMLRGRFWRPATGPLQFPGIMEVAMRASLLHSSWREKEALSQADFCLRPPIEPFALMAFEQMDEIAEVGYAYAREALAEWVKGEGIGNRE